MKFAEAWYELRREIKEAREHGLNSISLSVLDVTLDELEEEYE